MFSSFLIEKQIFDNFSLPSLCCVTSELCQFVNIIGPLAAEYENL